MNRRSDPRFDDSVPVRSAQRTDLDRNALAGSRHRDADLDLDGAPPSTPVSHPASAAAGHRHAQVIIARVFVSGQIIEITGLPAVVLDSSLEFGGCLTEVPASGTQVRESTRRTSMAKNTSFILGDHFDAFVASQVEAGRYRNATDVIRSGLRLLEERETRLQALRQALIEGERSGIAGPLDTEKIKRQAREAAGLSPS
jgi:antitoxin ParD1/3/4